MCKEANKVRSIPLLEGHARWIMERETPEERLAAWETLVAIAFPPPYELPYVPPSLPVDVRNYLNAIGLVGTPTTWLPISSIADAGRFKTEKTERRLRLEDWEHQSDIGR